METLVDRQPFLLGGGEMGMLTRSYDWETSQLGSPEQWPQSLQTTVAMILSSKFPMFLWWGDDMIQFYNDAYRPSLGNNGKHPLALGQKAKDCWPEIWDIIYPLIEQVRKKGEATWSEDQLVPIYRNGKIEDVYWTFGYSPIRSENGNIDGVLVVCTETTEKIKNLKNLELANQQFKNYVMQAPVAIAVFRGKELIADIANNAYLPLVGKSRDEFVGKPLFETLPETKEILEPIISQVISTGTAFSANEFELVLKRNNKSDVCYFNYVYEPIRNAEMEIDGFMVVAHEVTEQVVARKKIIETETSFRHTILKAPVAMCVFTGPDHVVEVANDLMVELWGKPSADVIGKPIFEGLPEAINQGFEEILDNVFNTGETCSAEGVPIRLPRNGSIETVYVNFVYAASREADGTISRILAIAVDVTAQVLAHQQIEKEVKKRTFELAEANNSLRRSNEELEQFAYIASHDLQEPARKISTFSQMLEHSLGEMSEQSKSYLSKIDTAAARMISLIRNVLAYSELGKGGQGFEKVDLKTVAENISTDYELLIEQKGAQIEYFGLPVIEAIPVQMSQLFSNIVSNSLKFTSTAEKPYVTISAAILSKEEMKQHAMLIDDNIYYNIEFKDNGIGVKAEDAKRIFNIFQRLHAKNEYAGTGIGLAMCKKIAVNHNGEIYATAGTTKGTIINVILPAKHISSTPN